MGIARATTYTLIALASGTAPLDAQSRRAEEAYFHAVGEFFTVPAAELTILRDWSLPADEVPVALFIAARGGVSAEAILALRRADESWADLAARYHVSPASLYVPLDRDASAGRLESVYQEFRSLPSSRWGEIRLSDREIVALVNVRLLAETLRMRPSDVLRVADPDRSFVEIYGELMR